MTPLNEMRIAMGKKPMGRPVGSYSKTDEQVYSRARKRRIDREAARDARMAVKAEKKAAKKGGKKRAMACLLVTDLTEMFSRWDRLIESDRSQDPIDRLPA